MGGQESGCCNGLLLPAWCGAARPLLTAALAVLCCDAMRCVAPCCAVQLDAGVPEQMLLLSRDEQSMLVVSYADIKVRGGGGGRGWGEGLVQRGDKMARPRGVITAIVIGHAAAASILVDSTRAIPPPFAWCFICWDQKTPWAGGVVGRGRGAPVSHCAFSGGSLPKPNVLPRHVLLPCAASSHAAQRCVEAAFGELRAQAQAARARARAQTDYTS